MSTPRAYATVTGPTATYTAPDGHTEPLTATGADDIRHAIVRRAADEAARTGEPIELVTHGDRGDHRLLVHTDGAVTPLEPSALRSPTTPLPIDSAPATRAESRRTDEPTTAPGASERDDLIDATVAADPDQLEAEQPRRRSSFIAAPTTRVEHETGWRGLFARVGIHVSPTTAQLAREADVDAVSRQWAGCRTIAVVNGKGGVGKTMTTAMLAAVYARHGGGNVLAWDNNDTRGTLGWRTQQGLYDTTIRDLLPAADELLQVGAGVSDITEFVHHQAADRYDVLRSNPELLAADQRITSDEFDLLMTVAARFYRLVVFDSGNDESSERWLRMVDDASQLVIPTLATPDSAESAGLLLDALEARDDHSAQLTQEAVVVVTQSEPGADVRRIADGFAGTVGDVVTIPFDPALKTGPLRFDTLRPRTRDAWIRAAAAAADNL